MFLIPAQDRRIRKYHDMARFLAPAGEWVPVMPEWFRAIKSGDVTQGSPKAESKPKAKKG